MPKIHNATAASDRKDWTTPPDLFAKLDDEFHFQLDAAASDHNTLCKKFLIDSLKQEWRPGPVFCNPPYGKVEVPLWMNLAWHQFQNWLRPIVMLVPAATETKWFYTAVQRAHSIRLLKGRLKFGNVVAKDGSVGVSSAPFPSAVVIFKVRPWGSLWSGADINMWDWRNE